MVQSQRDVGGRITGWGSYGDGGLTPENTFGTIISRIIGLLTIVAGVYFMFLLIIGGISWMSAGGDKGKLEKARSSMINGAVGLAIVVAGIFIVQIIGDLIGIGDLLNPASLINSIRA